MDTSRALEILISVRADRNYQDTVGGIKDDMLDITKMAGAAVAAIGGIATITDAMLEGEDATAKLAAQLGIAVDEAGHLSEVGKAIYQGAWGESIAEVNTLVTQATQGLQRLQKASSEAIQTETQNAMTLGSIWEDTEKQLQASITLQRDFNLTQQQAYDLLASGFQRGLNTSEDFLDSILEYSNQFAVGGASAGQFFSVLESGLASGVLGTDKAADMFKEFQVRIIDGSTATSDALDMLGMSSDDVTATINSGQMTVADAFQMVVHKLQSVDDKSVQMQAGVGLLGTQLEDLGLDAALSVNMAARSMEDFAGAMDNANQVNNTLSVVMTESWRTLVGTIANSDAAHTGIAMLTQGFQSFTGIIHQAKEHSDVLTMGLTALAVRGLAPVAAHLAVSTAATLAHASAMTAAATSTRLATGALALLGGPVGVAALAGTALYYVYQSSENAKNSIELLDGSMKTHADILAESTQLQREYTYATEEKRASIRASITDLLFSAEAHREEAAAVLAAQKAKLADKQQTVKKARGIAKGAAYSQVNQLANQIAASEAALNQSEETVQGLRQRLSDLDKATALPALNVPALPALPTPDVNTPSPNGSKSTLSPQFADDLKKANEAFKYQQILLEHGEKAANAYKLSTEGLSSAQAEQVLQLEESTARLEEQAQAREYALGVLEDAAKALALETVRREEGEDAACQYELILEGLTDTQAKEVVELEKQTEALKAQNQARAEAEDHIAELQQELQIQTLRLTEGADAARLYELSIDGYSEAQAHAVLGTEKQIDALEEQATVLKEQEKLWNDAGMWAYDYFTGVINGSTSLKEAFGNLKGSLRNTFQSNQRQQFNNYLSGNNTPTALDSMKLGGSSGMLSGIAGMMGGDMGNSIMSLGGQMDSMAGAAGGYGNVLGLSQVIWIYSVAILKAGCHRCGV